jgi:hypothetical protein
MMTMHPPLTRDLAPVVDSEPKHEVAAIEPVKVTAHWKRRAIVAFVVACNGAINFGELPVGVRVVSWALVVLFAFIALAQP